MYDSGCAHGSYGGDEDSQISILITNFRENVAHTVENLEISWRQVDELRQRREIYIKNEIE